MNYFGSDEKRKIKITIIAGVKLEIEEKHQLMLSKIGKDEEIRKRALRKFENFQRIKEIKNFIKSEARKRKVELDSIEFDGNNIIVIVFSNSNYNESDVELYVFEYLYFLQIEKKMPDGIIIHKDSVVAEY